MVIGRVEEHGEMVAQSYQPDDTFVIIFYQIGTIQRKGEACICRTCSGTNRGTEKEGPKEVPEAREVRHFRSMC